MQAADAVVVALPRGTPDAEIAEMRFQLERLDAVEAVVPGETRGLAEAAGAVIILKIAQEALTATARLLSILNQTINVLRNRNITTAKITLPNGTTVEVTGSMWQEEVERTLLAAVKAAHRSA
jgi:hypothetical protein